MSGGGSSPPNTHPTTGNPGFLFPLPTPPYTHTQKEGGDPWPQETASCSTPWGAEPGSARLPEGYPCSSSGRIRPLACAHKLRLLPPATQSGLPLSATGSLPGEQVPRVGTCLHAPCGELPASVVAAGSPLPWADASCTAPTSDGLVVQGRAGGGALPLFG